MEITTAPTSEPVNAPVIEAVGEIAGEPTKGRKRKGSTVDGEEKKPKKPRAKKEPELDADGKPIIKPKKQRTRKVVDLDAEGKPIAPPKKPRAKKQKAVDQVAVVPTVDPIPSCSTELPLIESEITRQEGVIIE